MPMPRVMLAAPGSMASQRIARLERELAEAKKELAECKKAVAVPEPPFQPIKCAFCRRWGHHRDHCYEAFIDGIESTKKFCSKGQHNPYQHGKDWRCNNCGKHLTEEQAAKCPQYERRRKLVTQDVGTQSDLSFEEFQEKILGPPVELVWDNPENRNRFYANGERRACDHGCWVG